MRGTTPIRVWIGTNLAHRLVPDTGVRLGRRVRSGACLAPVPRPRTPTRWSQAACERLIPAVDGHPGATALGVADYIDGLLGAFLVDPPRDLRGRAVLRPLRRRGPVRRVHAARAARGAGLAHPDRGFARASRSGSATARCRAGSSEYARRASRRSAPTSPPSTGPSRSAGSTPIPEFKQLPVRARVRGRVRRARVRRQPRRPRAGRRSSSPATSSRAGTRTRRSRAVSEGLRRGDRRQRTGGRDRGRRAHRRGLVGDRAREGSQPPARPRAPVRAGSATCRTTRSSSPGATSSVPTRCSSRARTGTAPRRATTTSTSAR